MTRRAARTAASVSPLSGASAPASEGASSSEKISFLTKLYDHLAATPTTPADRAPRVRAASAPAAYVPSTSASSTRIPSPPASAIRWTDDGDAIVVSSVEELKKHTLRPLYGHQNMETFIRQMAIYGHSRSRPVPGEVHFRHPEFRRDTPRADILNVVRKATSKTHRSVSSSLAKALTTQASSIKGRKTTRRVVSDPPSSSPLPPRASRGIVKRKPKMRGLGPAPATSDIKVKEAAPIRRSASLKLPGPPRVLPLPKRAPPPSSDADDESDVVVVSRIATLVTSKVAKRPARKSSTNVDPTPTKVPTSSHLLQISAAEDAPALIPFPSMSPVKRPMALFPPTIFPSALVQPMTASSSRGSLDAVAKSLTATDVDMIDTSSVSSLDMPTVSPILVARHSNRAAEVESRPTLTPLNVALSRTLDSFAFPAGYPSAALYPTRPRSTPLRRVVDTTDSGARAPIHRRPSLPSLVALGLTGRGSGLSATPNPPTSQAMCRTRSQSLLTSSAAQVASATNLVVSPPPADAGSFSSLWSPAFDRWQAAPPSPWSSTASESSLRTPLDTEMSLPVILESPPTPVARTACPILASTGLESNVLGIHLGGGPIPWRSTVTLSHLSPTHFTLAPAPPGPRIYAALPNSEKGGRHIIA